MTKKNFVKLLKENLPIGRDSVYRTGMQVPNTLKDISHYKFRSGKNKNYRALTQAEIDIFEKSTEYFSRMHDWGDRGFYFIPLDDEYEKWYYIHGNGGEAKYITFKEFKDQMMHGFKCKVDLYRTSQSSIIADAIMRTAKGKAEIETAKHVLKTCKKSLTPSAMAGIMEELRVIAKAAKMSVDKYAASKNIDNLIKTLKWGDK